MVIHRAMAGSFERFIAILIEHFAGAFPGLARAGAGAGDPDLGCAGRRRPAALADRLKAAGIRAHLDDRSETLNYRIREGEV